VVVGGAAAVALLAVLADGYFYPNPHLPLAIWLVVATMGLCWGAELAGWRLPNWLLGAAHLGPLCWLAVLRRADVAPLFLLLLVAWVGYTRTRRDGAILLGCCLAYFWLATPTPAVDGTVRLVGWYSWPIALLWASSLIPVWLAVRGLVAQQRLLIALRAAQAELGRQAASDERRRIAREIHDIVAHSLTVTMLHLTGARFILARDPDGAAAALVEAERLGRQSLADVRRTVGLLEAEADPRVQSLAPLPSAEDIATLVHDYTRLVSMPSTSAAVTWLVCRPRQGWRCIESHKKRSPMWPNTPRTHTSTWSCEPSRACVCASQTTESPISRLPERGRTPPPGWASQVCTSVRCCSAGR
jgi:Histidine kinase